MLPNGRSLRQDVRAQYTIRLSAYVSSARGTDRTGLSLRPSEGMHHTRLPTNTPSMQTRPLRQVVARLWQWGVLPGRDTQRHVVRHLPKRLREHTSEASIFRLHDHRRDTIRMGRHCLRAMLPSIQSAYCNRLSLVLPFVISFLTLLYCAGFAALSHYASVFQVYGTVG